MFIRELADWPPALTDSRTSRMVSSTTLPATLKRCGIYTLADPAAAYLSLVVNYDGRDWHAMLHDLPGPLLWRVEATLRGHEGQPLAELGSLEIVEPN